MKKFKIAFLLFCLFLPLAFLGCENFNKNTLSTPSNLSVKNGVIVFDMVKNAEYYIININDTEITLDAKYSNSVDLIDNQVNYNANKIFSVGESYTIKIKAIADEMKDSKYTNSISYKHTTTISKVENIKINGTTLTWDLVKNASFYLVKIVTPYNTKLYDSLGNELTGDDSETIAKAELTAYSFSSNAFNFGTLLTQAGNYKFYINAVSADGSKYSDSGYTNKITYTHSIQLEEPTIGKVVKDANGDLLLNAVIDNHSNNITISCNEFKKSIELSNLSLIPNLITKNNNEYKINLTNCFNEIDFSVVKPYEFKIQASNITGGEQSFYLSSSYSATSVYESTSKLATPTLNIINNEKHNCKEAQWVYADENVSKFNVYVLTSSKGLSIFELESTENSLLLPNDFYAVGIQAVGSGNYLSSGISNFKTSSTSSTLSNINIVKSNNNTLTWNNIAGATYFVDFNNELLVTTTNSLEIDLNKINNKQTSLKLTIVKEGYLPYIVEYKFNYTPKLKTPTVHGFVSSNPYLLTFENIENAIGYYLQIKASNQQEYNLIQHLYTSNAIDLSQYVMSEDDNISYSVKVQAVADSNSLYLNSDYSNSANVSHQRILSKPSFIGDGVMKKVENSQTIYTLNFKGVENAESYEILINYNKITLPATNENVYSKDISQYLTSANNYEIKIRAIPSVYATNLFPSDYATTNYILTKQLDQVEQIKVTINNDSQYTLSFNPVNNAVEYRVRIVKLADSEYTSNLNAIGKKNIFEIQQATNITEWLTWKGEYHIYMTALPSESGYYGPSDESSTFAVVNKLESLKTPTSLKFENIEEDNAYNLSWVGDDHADYYLVKVVDPNGFKYEFNVYGETSTNVSSYLTIQGYYSFSVYSMITPNSENSVNYTSSSYGEIGNTYTYEQIQDFKRYSVSIYGGKYDYLIENVQELKNILWYHLIYGINEEYKLPIYIATGEGEQVRDKLVDIADSATQAGLYDFDADSIWTTSYSPTNNSKTNAELLQYVSDKLLNIYPSLHIISSVSVSANENNKNIFYLYYKNTLTPSTDNNLISTATDYNTFFKYLDTSARRGESVKFEIDNKTGVAVTTSEQLLHAAENGYKPLFCGESENAEKIYNNAKAILRTIVTSNMSELEKTARIFDWLSYAYNINFYADKIKVTHSDDPVTYENATIDQYGNRKEFYLEGMFMNIPIEDGKFNETSYTKQTATSSSLSKAFSLLCAIEGIKTISVNGYYTSNSITYNHTWNKVYISTTSNVNDKNWYVVDIAMSETQADRTSKTYTYFLVTDEMHKTKLNSTENTKVFTISASTTYDYYKTATFGLTVNEVYKYVTTNIYNYTERKNFNFSKSFNPSNSYYTYRIKDLNSMQSYLFDIVFYTKYMLTLSKQNSVSFDFSFDWANNNNVDNFYLSFNDIKGEIDDIVSLIESYYDTNLYIELNYAEQIKDETNNRTIVILTFKNK